MLRNPLAVGELEDQRAVELPWRVQVEVFEAGRLFQLGEAEPVGESAAVALGDLAVDEQPQALKEAEAFDVSHLLLLLQRLEHAGELEGAELVESRVCQHVLSPF